MALFAAFGAIVSPSLRVQVMFRVGLPLRGAKFCNRLR